MSDSQNLYHRDKPDLHDGLLNGVLVFDKRALIQATTVNGEPWTISLEGVSTLRVIDMREGNIILDCEVMETSEIAGDALEELFRGNQRDTELAHWKEQIDSGARKLLLITPSYGATVIALAKAVEAVRGHSDASVLKASSPTI